MSRHGKVLVAMSGGIDSTVVALMLHEQGYEVIGITMKTWDYASSGGSKKETGCCNLDSFNDARAAAVHHGFHHYILDIREEFGGFVVENFVDEYLAGAAVQQVGQATKYVPGQPVVPHGATRHGIDAPANVFVAFLARVVESQVVEKTKGFLQGQRHGQILFRSEAPCHSLPAPAAFRAWPLCPACASRRS